MAIMHGFDVDGNFVAVDTVTKAASLAYKRSEHWNNAKNDPDAAAQAMIAGELELRDMIPDLPSVQPEPWNANFAAMADRLGKAKVADIQTSLAALTRSQLATR